MSDTFFSGVVSYLYAIFAPSDRCRRGTEKQDAYRLPSGGANGRILAFQASNAPDDE